MVSKSNEFSDSAEDAVGSLEKAMATISKPLKGIAKAKNQSKNRHVSPSGQVRSIKASAPTVEALPATPTD